MGGRREGTARGWGGPVVVLVGGGGGGGGRG